MQYEQDYIMRMIKEMTRVLFSLLLGKKYVQVELPEVNRYQVSGKRLDEYKNMIDRGEINEAENMLLEDIDYTKKEEIVVAVYFYQYLSEKSEKFLMQNNYSKEEVADGLKQLSKHAGYQEVGDIIL